MMIGTRITSCEAAQASAARPAAVAEQPDVAGPDMELCSSLRRCRVRQVCAAAIPFGPISGMPAASLGAAAPVSMQAFSAGTITGHKRRARKLDVDSADTASEPIDGPASPWIMVPLAKRINVEEPDSPSTQNMVVGGPVRRIDVRFDDRQKLLGEVQRLCQEHPHLLGETLRMAGDSYQHILRINGDSSHALNVAIRYATLFVDANRSLASTSLPPQTASRVTEMFGKIYIFLLTNRNQEGRQTTSSTAALRVADRVTRDYLENFLNFFNKMVDIYQKNNITTEAASDFAGNFIARIQDATEEVYKESFRTTKNCDAAANAQKSYYSALVQGMLDFFAIIYDTTRDRDYAETLSLSVGEPLRKYFIKAYHLVYGRIGDQGEAAAFAWDQCVETTLFFAKAYHANATNLRQVAERATYEAFSALGDGLLRTYEFVYVSTLSHESAVDVVSEAREDFGTTYTSELKRVGYGGSTQALAAAYRAANRTVVNGTRREISRFQPVEASQHALDESIQLFDAQRADEEDILASELDEATSEEVADATRPAQAPAAMPQRSPEDSSRQTAVGPIGQGAAAPAHAPHRDSSGTPRVTPRAIRVHSSDDATLLELIGRLSVTPRQPTSSSRAHSS